MPHPAIWTEQVSSIEDLFHVDTHHTTHDREMTKRMRHDVSFGTFTHGDLSIKKSWSIPTGFSRMQRVLLLGFELEEHSSASLKVPAVADRKTALPQ